MLYDYKLITPVCEFDARIKGFSLFLPINNYWIDYDGPVWKVILWSFSGEYTGECDLFSFNF